MKLQTYKNRIVMELMTQRTAPRVVITQYVSDEVKKQVEKEREEFRKRMALDTEYLQYLYKRNYGK